MEAKRIFVQGSQEIYPSVMTRQSMGRDIISRGTPASLIINHQKQAKLALIRLDYRLTGINVCRMSHC